MAPQKTTARDIDEEIIDLTDIIEKGTAPIPQKADNLDSQMSDLFAKNASAPAAAGADVDADIDALLSQMNSGETPGGSSADSAHVVNPNETLDMPGMDDVDALLGNLDIPPQPRPAAQAAPPSPNQNAPEGLDSLLDTMMDRGSATPATTQTTTDDDLDALFGEAAVAPAQSEPAPPASKAPATQKNAADDMDLDALFGQDAPRQNVVPQKKTPQPSVPAAPEGSGGIDDLDALFGEAAVAPAQSEPAPPASKAPATQKNVADDMDLDALFGQDAPRQNVAPQKKTPQPSVPAAPEGSGGIDDLDTLFGEAAVAPTQSEPAPPASKAPATQKNAADDMDLDALFGQDAPRQNVASPTAVPVTPPAHTAANKLDDLDVLLGDAPEQPKSAGSGAEAPVRKSGATSQTRPSPEELDALLGDVPEERLSPVSEEDIVDPKEASRAAQELLDEKVMLEATTSGDVDTDAWMNSLDEALDEQEKGSRPTRKADSALDAEVESLLPSDEELDALLKEDEQPAHLPPSDTANGLSERLERYEKELRELRSLAETYSRDLTETEARLTAMEAVPPPPPVPTPSLDELLQEGSPLYNGLVELVCSAVATALSEQEQARPPAPALPPNLEQRLLILEQHMEAQAETDFAGLESRLNALEEQSLAGEAMSARLDRLETRVDALPPGLVDDLTGRLTALEDPTGRDALEQRLDALERRPEPLVPDTGALEQRIEMLEAAAAAAPATTDLERRLEALEKAAAVPEQETLARRLDAVENRLGEAAPEELARRLALLEQRTEAKALEERLDVLEARPLPPPVDMEALEHRLVTLEARPEAPQEEMRRLEQRLEALEAQPAPHPVDVATLEERLAALEARPIPITVDAEALEQRLAVLETRSEAPEDEIRRLGQRLKALEERPAPEIVDAQALEQRLTVLENRPATPPADLEALEQRLNALEDQTSAPAVVSTALEERLDALEASSATAVATEMLEQRVAVLEQRPVETSPELEALQQRLTSLEEAASVSASGDTVERLSALESELQSRISVLEQNIDKSAATAAARIIREEIAGLMSA